MAAMINIKLKEPISNIIEQLHSVPLERFSVITGVNGTGKTQLLKGIKNGQIQIQYKKQVLDPKLVTLIGLNDVLQPINIMSADYDLWREKADAYNYFKRWNMFDNKERQALRAVAEKNNTQNVNCIDPIFIHDDNLKQKYKNYLSFTQERIRHMESGESELAPFLRILVDITNPQNLNIHFIDESDHLVSHKDVALIENTTILRSISRPRQIQTSSVQASIGDQEETTMGNLLPALNLLIYSYCKRYKENLGQFALHKNRDENHPNAIPKKEFLARFPKPWDIINEFLRYFSDFDHRIEAVDLESFSINVPINVVLKNQNDVSVSFGSLSSGEHTIFKLVCLLISAKLGNSYIPQAILLDEVDAMLHPSMCVAFINATRDIFSDGLDIPTIIVSHSMSSVAQTPNNNLYTLERMDNGVVISKKSKECVFDILSAGFIAYSEAENQARISIAVSRARQKPILFVEGVTDKIIIKTAWRKIRGSEEQFFKIIHCGDATQIRKKIEMETIEELSGKHLALFDFDEAGYSNWNGLKCKQYAKPAGELAEGLYRTRVAKGIQITAMLLPVPVHRSQYANETLADDSLLSIEMVFDDNVLAEGKNLQKKPLPGGESIKVFCGDKMHFAEKKVSGLSSSAFAPFKGLIEAIERHLA